MINQLEPIAVEDVNARVVVPGKLFNIELLFDQDSRGDQAHIVVGVLDNVVYQLLSELLVLVYLERIAIEVAEKFFKLVEVHHVAVGVIHLVEEFKKLV